MDVVYLDFQKAFDKVPHQRLLLKLKAHGIGNDVINWIEKWLTHRKQRVIVDGEISNWKSVLSGVPQGSVLGPILFLIYINDLEDDISSKVLKFADDTKVFRKVTNDTYKQSLQNDLDKLVKSGFGNLFERRAKLVTWNRSAGHTYKHARGSTHARTHARTHAHIRILSFL